MAEPLTLPFEPRQTSRDAAEAAKPIAGAQRKRLYEYGKRHARNGWTDDEYEAATGVSPSTIRPRRRELMAAGLAGWSGRTRPTRSGRQANVWIVAGYGPFETLPETSEERLRRENEALRQQVAERDARIANMQQELAECGLGLG